MIAFVQANSATANANSNPTNVALTGVTFGNSIVVFAWVSNAITVSSVTDDKGNAYQRIINNFNGSSYCLSAYVAIGVASGTTTISVNYSGTGWPTIIMANEISGAGSVYSTGATSGGTANANPQSTGTIITTSQNSLTIAGLLIATTPVTLSLGSGQTNLSTVSSGSLSVATEVGAVSSPASSNPTFGVNVTNWGFNGGTIALRAPQAATGQQPLRPHAFSPGLAR